MGDMEVYHFHRYMKKLVKVTEQIAKLVGEHRRIQSALLQAAENGQEPAVGSDLRIAEIIAELADLGVEKKDLIDNLNAFENFYAKRIHDIQLIVKHLRRVHQVKVDENVIKREGIQKFARGNGIAIIP